MADENTIDYPALCEELSARVTELETALTEEQDKNAVLVQQVVDAEGNIEVDTGSLVGLRCGRTSSSLHRAVLPQGRAGLPAMRSLGS